MWVMWMRWTHDKSRVKGFLTGLVLGLLVGLLVAGAFR